MRTRIIAGTIAAVAVVALILWGPANAMLLVVLGCAGLSCLEFDKLFFVQKSAMRQLRGLSLVFLSILTLRSAPEMAWVFFWLPLFVLSIQHVIRANTRGDFEQSIRDLSIELLGVLYVVCMLGFIMPIVESGEHGREFLLLLFFLVFSGDTFAYFVGTFWGRHLLANQISPKKSLEGSAGAVVGSLIFAGLWIGLVYTGEPTRAFLVSIVLLVPVVSVLAQVGDLFESMLKRSRAQKDSGQFLPGHGGILDRLDGLTLSAPAFYFFLRYILERI
jgi:phosphatidate cytidylyltransferase